MLESKVIDLDKRVGDLTPEEIIYLHNNLVNSQDDGNKNKYKQEFQEYPKFLPEFNVVVQDAKEEEALYKNKADNTEKAIELIKADIAKDDEVKAETEESKKKAK